MTDNAARRSEAAATANEQTNIDTNLTKEKVTNMVNTKTNKTAQALQSILLSKQEDAVRQAYLDKRQAELEHAFKPSDTGAVSGEIADMANAIYKLEQQRLANLKGEVTYSNHSDAKVCSSLDEEGTYRDYTSGIVGVMYFGGSEPASIPRNGYSKFDLERMEYRITASASESLYKGPIVDDEEQFIPEEWGCEAVTEDLAEWLGITDTIEDIEDEEDRQQNLAIEEFTAKSNIERVMLLTGGIGDNSDLL